MFDILVCVKSGVDLSRRSMQDWLIHDITKTLARIFPSRAYGNF